MCQLKIHRLIATEFGKPYTVAFGNVHRFRIPGLNGVHSIVAKFIHRSEYEKVLNNKLQNENSVGTTVRVL